MLGLSTCKLATSSLYDQKCKGAQIRSRSKWIYEGEKNTKYFFNLEKRHQSSNVIKELRTQEGNLSNDYEIIGEMCKLMKHYTQVRISMTRVLIYTLKILLLILCELFPSFEECNDTVMSLKNK